MCIYSRNWVMSTLKNIPQHRRIFRSCLFWKIILISSFASIWGFSLFASLQIALFWIIKTNVQSASIVLLITRSVHTYRNLNRENAICISGHASLNLPIIWLLEERSITFTPWKCHINRLVINQIGLPITIIISL